MLIPRGHCEFVTKALNAQKLGAQMAIIMDDKEHEQMVLMADNGYGRYPSTQATKLKFPPSLSIMRMESC
jgi:hypothetical protein